MKKAEQKRLIELLTKQVTDTLNLSESKELLKLQRCSTRNTSDKVKSDKDKFAKAQEKADKRAKNIIRMAIVQALEVYDDLGLDISERAFNVTYKAKAKAKPSSKYIEIKTPLAIRKRAKVKNAKAVEQAKVKAEADKVLKPLFDNLMK